VIETFTFLDRRPSRAHARIWRDSLQTVAKLHIVGCQAKELGSAVWLLEERRWQRVSLVDATSFVLMRHNDIQTVFGFDTHFSAAGFMFVSVASRS